MDASVFEAPFYFAEIEDTGDTEIIVRGAGRTDRKFYTVDPAEDPERVCRAVNLLWQAMTYGMPDPELRDRFVSTYGPGAYDEYDVDMIGSSMLAMGLVDPNFHRRSVH